MRVVIPMIARRAIANRRSRFFRMCAGDAAGNFRGRRCANLRCIIRITITPDGSNWELLCLYCHDDEHQDSEGSGGSRELHSEGSLGNNPFAGLKGMIDSEEDD